MPTTVGTCIANNCTIQIPCCNASVGTCIQLVTDDYIMHLSIVFPSPRTWWGRFPSFCGKKCPWGRAFALRLFCMKKLKYTELYLMAFSSLRFSSLRSLLLCYLKALQSADAFLYLIVHCCASVPVVFR